MTILAGQAQTVQFVTADDDCPAYRWGYNDGMDGQSEFTGYDYFVGWRLQLYLEGHRAGMTMRQMLQGVVLDEVRRTLQGDPTFEAWQAEGSPVSGATWSGGYDDVTAAEYRSDYIGS